MRAIRSGLAALCLLSSAQAGAAVFTVGSAGCTHPNLPAAVAAAMANGPGADEIRLVSGQVPAMNAPLSIGAQSLTLRGGFGTCSAPEPSGGSTTLSFPSSDAIVFAADDAAIRRLTLEGIRVIMPADTGRILRVSGWANVTLQETFFSRGSAPQGGNVHLSGPDAQITLERGSRIYQGRANQGGGIYCSGGAFIAVLGDSSIDANVAAGDGGGVYLDDCGLGGGSLYGPFVIADNRSEGGHGGGVFATNNASITLYGSDPEAIVIGDNTAPAGRGGGIDAAGAGTYIGIDNAWITGNLARFGGGVNIGAGAEGVLRAQDCRQRLSRPCNLISGNVAAGGSGVTNTGGALRVTGGGQLTVRRAMVRNNHAEDNGSVLFATDAGSTVVLENTVVTGNTGSLNQQFVTLEDGAAATLAHVTAHAQQIGCCKHFFGRGPGTQLRVYSSIIHEERLFAPAGAGSSTAMDCVIVPGLGDIPPGDFVTGVADAARLFRLRTAIDLLPRPRSPLIDYCDTAVYPSPAMDFNGWPRPHDVPDVSHGVSGGNHDLGAVEASWIFAGDFQPD